MEYMPKEGVLGGIMAPLTNLLLVVSYDGTRFNGWNGMPLCSSIPNRGLDSVANCLLKPLLALHGFDASSKYLDYGFSGGPAGEGGAQSPEAKIMNFSLVGASRTDKGVHAQGMVCQYRSFTRFPPLDGDLMQIYTRMNRMIPPSIRINAMLHVNDPKVPQNSFSSWCGSTISVKSTPIGSA